MSGKKRMLMLGAVAMLALTGCTNNVVNEEVHSSPEKSATEDVDAPAEDEGYPEAEDEMTDVYGDTGVAMMLDAEGGLEIVRKEIGSTPMGEAGTWTIFVYLCGTDLESGNGLATIDIQEMMGVSTDSRVKFVVQTGGTNVWRNDLVSSECIQRYEITGGEIYPIEELPAASMGDGNTLLDFLTWGVGNYPAAKMGLIFWNHGGGSITGVCFDELNELDSLSLPEIDSALASASDSMTDKFEFIGFDACLMGTIETANVLATYARYMYGSEETEPGYGWDYTAIGSYLNQNPEADGAGLGQIVCDTFYDSCAAINAESGATLSVTDLSKIDQLVISFHEYARELYESSADTAILSNVVRGIITADNYGGNNKSEGYTNMVDLAGIVNAGSEYSDSAGAVLAAIEEAVVYKKNGSNHTEACGLSTYYPLELQGSDELKIFGSIAVSPYYLSFVDRTVYSGINSGDGMEYDNSDVLNGWSGEDAEEESYWDGYEDYSITGESPFVEFYDEPQIFEDGSYGFSLTDESLQHIAGVNANVFMISEDAQDIIELGVSVDIKPDWENGIFMDNFDGCWFSLPDGQMLAVYVVDECEGYDVYTSPIMLNGEETNLRITHDYVNNIVSIDGVWDGIQENGMAARDIYTLQENDTILPMYFSTGIEGGEQSYYYGNEYVFDGESQIYFDKLFDGEYLYGFTIDDSYGDYLVTDFVNFTVDGENIYFDDLK